MQTFSLLQILINSILLIFHLSSSNAIYTKRITFVTSHLRHHCRSDSVIRGHQSRGEPAILACSVHRLHRQKSTAVSTAAGPPLGGSPKNLLLEDGAHLDGLKKNRLEQSEHTSVGIRRTGLHENLFLLLRNSRLLCAVRIEGWKLGKKNKKKGGGFLENFWR
ncbi:hypothetical protein STAS_23000 [Striga asiatica]|uniref:Uncharacterized protein n=1 Tax=Striga asiatica TaxID=4170 RepID=A0A5A7QQ49_STRAF|nr:hypothetical protein STAS_23000 [Striga asiatica]